MIGLIVLFLLLILGFLIRDYLFSLYLYLKKRVEGKKLNITRLNSLRADLIHESKKKFAGLGQILNSCSENPTFLRDHLDYFNQLIQQLKTLIEQQRENLLLCSEDVFVYAKLKNRIRKIENRVKKKRYDKERIERIRKDLQKLQEGIEKNVDQATKRFSFNFIDSVKDAVKIVRIEKRDTLEKKKIDLVEDHAEIKRPIRLPYSVHKDWLRVLTNLIRNAIEAVEAKQSGAWGLGLVAADFSLRGGGETGWVRVSTKQSVSVSPSVSVCIEDSGIGMDEITKSSFYKKGFTSGKEGGLGLGVSEESVELIHRYGEWQIESEPGKGTKIIIEVQKEKAEKERIEIEGKRTILQEVFPIPSRVVLVGLLLIVVGLGILVTVDKYSRFWEDWNPAFAEVEQGKQVVVLNSDGKRLWMHEFERNVVMTVDGEGNKSPLVKIEDLDRDGRNEVLIAIMYGAQTGGQLFCVDYEGKVKWVFSGGQGYEDFSTIQSKDFKPEIFEIRNFLVDDFLGNGKKGILVISILRAYYPCQLAMLDHQGNVCGEYWHPGFVPYTFFLDLDGDGNKELLCAGINNKLNCRAVVFLLAIKELLGKHQAPPYNIFDDLKPAKEKKYVVLPNIKDVAWKWVEASPLATPKYMGIRTDDIFLILWDGRHYSLSKNLEYNSCEHRISAFSNWKELIKFPFELNLSLDSLNWKNFEVWKNGVKVK